MQAKVFSALLCSAADLAGSCGDQGLAQDLRALEAAFASAGTRKVASFLAAAFDEHTASQKPASPDPRTLRVAEFIRALRAVMLHTKAGKAVPPALDALAAQLQKSSALGPSAFAEHLIAAPPANARKNARSKPPQPGTELRTDVIRRHVSALENAASAYAHARFDQALAAATSDKQVRKEELMAIATEFLGFKPRGRHTRQKLAELISQRYADNARQHARARQSSL